MSATTVRRDIKFALVALTVASSSLDVTAFLRLGGLFATITVRFHAAGHGTLTGKVQATFARGKKAKNGGKEKR